MRIAYKRVSHTGEFLEETSLGKSLARGPRPLASAAGGGGGGAGSAVAEQGLVRPRGRVRSPFAFRHGTGVEFSLHPGLG
uniref:Uncharacterized protein n=1 Tax=Panthera leo TaxID=9689 RepID=A0A8C8WF08_PANLE